MSGIALSTPLQRGADTTVDITSININYDAQAVTVSLRYKPSGQIGSVSFGGPQVATLRQNVPQFSGLRVALLQYLQTLDATLAGSVT